MQGVYVCVLAVLVSSLDAVWAYPSVHAVDPVEQAKEFVAAADEYVAQAKLGDVPTPDLSYSGLLASGSIRNARIADLSTFYVRGEDQYVELNVPEVDKKVSYFRLNLGLEKFLVTYDFKYRFLVFNGEGHAEITALNNALQINGTVIRHTLDGSCIAVLNSAELTELSNFEATIKPKSLVHSLVASVMQFAKNHVLPSDIPIFNKLIADQTATENFRKTFSEVVCNTLK